LSDDLNSLFLDEFASCEISLFDTASAHEVVHDRNVFWRKMISNIVQRGNAFNPVGFPPKYTSTPKIMKKFEKKLLGQ